MKRSKINVRRSLYRVALATICVFVLAVGICVYHGVSTSLHGERALHAVNLMTVVADSFVRQEKRWPKSWDELGLVGSVDAPSMYSWPQDSERVQRLVTINFDSDIAAIASQTVEQFDKIEPIGACYPYKDYGFVESLVQSAKDASKASDTPSALPVIDAATDYDRTIDSTGDLGLPVGEASSWARSP